MFELSFAEKRRQSRRGHVLNASHGGGPINLSMSRVAGALHTGSLVKLGNDGVKTSRTHLRPKRHASRRLSDTHQGLGIVDR